MISVGIDVSKGKSMVCILRPGGEVLRPPFEINHTANELENLVALIKSYNEEIRVVLEDTGHYHLPVVVPLVESGIFVCCVNALRMKKFCSQSIRRAKTDKIDSIKIANFGLTYWSELTPTLPNGEVYQELKLLARQYYQTVSLLIKAKVNMSNLLDQTMPNIQTVLADNNSNSKLTDFVARYYHYKHILEMGEQDFTKDYCTWAKEKGYRLNERKAAQIFALAQNGIPTLPNSVSTQIAVSEAVKLIQSITESRNTILAQMQEFCKSLPEYFIVKEMPSIGETLAPRIVAEIGDIRRFKNKHSLVAYAGIDAPPYQSGAFSASERHIPNAVTNICEKPRLKLCKALSNISRRAILSTISFKRNATRVNLPRKLW